MAITPRTVYRNPLLMFFFSLFALGGLYYLWAPCASTCGAQRDSAPVVRYEAAKTVNMATIEAAKSTGYGWLGIEIKTFTPNDATRLGLQPTAGVLVGALQSGRPAELAGMKRHDVITHFDGKPVYNACQLKKRVAAKAPGSKVAVRVMRDDQPMLIHAVLTDKGGPLGCGTACR